MLFLEKAFWEYEKKAGDYEIYRNELANLGTILMLVTSVWGY